MAAREVAIIIKAKDQASKVFEGIGSRLAGIGKIALAGAAVGVAALGAAITKFAVDAAPLADIEKGFHSLAKTYDIDSKAMLAAMGKASRGTVADIDLMAAANKALVGSGKELGQQFGQSLPKLLEIARASAKVTGEDVGFLFESLVLGIKRGSPMIIDNTGLQIKLGEANEALAVKLGKSVDELTAQEKSIALLNATMEAGESMVASMGDAELTAAEQMAVMRAELKQATFELGKAFLPILTRVSKVFTGVITYLARKAIPIAQKFGKALDRFFGIAAKAIEGIGEAFEFLRAGDVEAFLERLWFAMDEVFGSRAADMVYQFGDMLFGLRHAFDLLRAGDVEAALDRLQSALANVFGPARAKWIADWGWQISDAISGVRDAFGYLRAGEIEKGLDRLRYGLANVFGPRVAGWMARFAGSLLSIGQKAKETFDRLKEGAVGLWQTHIYPRFVAIREGLQKWWGEIGGVGGVLDRIGAGWQKYIAGPLEGFWAAHLAGPLGTIRGKIGTWWTRMGGVTGILGRIGAGWRKYIAEPLSGFYSAYLAPGLHAIGAGIRAWWAQQGGASGILTKIAAGWNKYIAMPLKGFWEAHLADKFDALRVGIEVWAGKIWTFIETNILVPIRDRLPKAVKETTTEVEGVAAAIEGMVAPPPEPWYKTLWEYLIRIARTLKEIALMKWTEALVIIDQMADKWDWVRVMLRRNIDQYAFLRKAGEKYGAAFDITHKEILSGWDTVIERMKTARSEYDTLREAMQKPIVIPEPQFRFTTPGLRGYQHGGVVPGPIGRPQMAVVHGGEEIFQRGARGRGRAGVYVDLRGAHFYGVSETLVEDLFEEERLQRALRGVRD